jgi:hypothetical protein
MKVYLSIPYTYNPEESFQIAQKVVAKLMQDGHIVFCGIIQGHFTKNYLPIELQESTKFWLEQSYPFIDWCESVYVVSIGEKGKDLIASSRGVQGEILYAQRTGKPVLFDISDLS